MGAFLQGDPSTLPLISLHFSAGGVCFHGNGFGNILPVFGNLGVIVKCVALLLKEN